MTETAAPRLAIDDLIADFELIDDWEERYRYLIELGRGLPALAEAAHSDANKVRGCASQVWLKTRFEPGETPGAPTRLFFEGDSDAHIVKGLVAVLIALFSGRTTAEILALDPEAIFSRIGLREHLTPQRSNGVNSMVERIRRDAQMAQSAAAGA